MGKAKQKVKRKRSPSVHIVIDNDGKAWIQESRLALNAAIAHIGVDAIASIYRGTLLKFETETKVKLKLTPWTLDS